MVRFKTRLEQSETPEMEAARLRRALFDISLKDGIKEIHRIANAAIGGEKYE